MGHAISKVLMRFWIALPNIVGDALMELETLTVTLRLGSNNSGFRKLRMSFEAPLFALE